MYGFYIDEDRRKARRAKWNTVRIISIGFFGVILLGSLLLWLPFSNHQPIRYIDALFTAVTCVCVTGLVTVVPAAQFTVAGKHHRSVWQPYPAVVSKGKSHMYHNLDIDTYRIPRFLQILQ